MAFITSLKSKSDISSQLKNQNLKNAKESSKKLEQETKNMELKLHELKVAMSFEKEEREQSGGLHWRAGKSGSLGGRYADSVLKKNSANNQNSRGNKISKTKIKILKDEPPTQHPVKSTSVKLPTDKENLVKVKGTPCGQCEKKSSQVSCIECGEDYCAGCFASFHLKGALKKHRSVPFNNNISKDNKSNNILKTPQHPEYRVETNPMKLTLSEIDLDVGLKEYVTSTTEGKGSLLSGEYNEKESKASFQEALNAWRGHPSPKNNNVEISTNTNSTKQENNVNINFTNSLSYADRLLLKKLRQLNLDSSDQPVSPNSTSPLTPHTVDEHTNIKSNDTRVDFNSLYKLSQSKSPESVQEYNLSESRLSTVEINDFMENLSGKIDKDLIADSTKKNTITNCWDKNKPGDTTTKNRRNQTNSPAFNVVDKNNDLALLSTNSTDGVQTFRSNSRGCKSRQKRITQRGLTTNRSKSGTPMTDETIRNFNSITKSPSYELQQVSSLPYKKSMVTNDSNLSAFFTAGVQSTHQEKTLTPRSNQATDSNDHKYKLSNKLYLMTPRSWCPNKSWNLQNSDQNTYGTVEPTQSSHTVKNSDNLGNLKNSKQGNQSETNDNIVSWRYSNTSTPMETENNVSINRNPSASHSKPVHSSTPTLLENRQSPSPDLNQYKNTSETSIKSSVTKNDKNTDECSTDYNLMERSDSFDSDLQESLDGNDLMALDELTQEINSQSEIQNAKMVTQSMYESAEDLREFTAHELAIELELSKQEEVERPISSVIGIDQVDSDDEVEELKAYQTLREEISSQISHTHDMPDPVQF